MHILFIDESGTIPPKNKMDGSKYFVLGGIVIPEELWHLLDKELTRLKEFYSIEGEIKWRYFVQGKEGALHTNSLSHLAGIQKNELRTAVYQLISKFKAIRLICAIVDVEKAYRSDELNNHNELYGVAYKAVTERFQYYLQDLSRTVGSKINGIIVCDHRQTQDDHHLRNLHQQLLCEKNYNLSNYKHLIEGVFIAPSHLSVGIQLADMIAGAVYRDCARGDSRYFEQIKESFRKSPEGKIAGYGLINLPKE